MKKLLYYLSVLFLISYSAHAQEAKTTTENSSPSSVLDFVKKGKPILDVRYLHESVTQKGIPNQADANTIRTRVGYETAKISNFSALVEIENIKGIGAENYNDTINKRTNYPTVSDPEVTMLNRLHVDYSGIEKTNIRLGRQIISLDNQRFLGGIAWRQNDQTMDAASVNTKLLKNTEIFYAHVTRVNRVFGTRSKVGTWNDNNINLTNIAHNFMQGVKLIAYNYLLDISDNTAFSSNTSGLRLELKHKFDDKLSTAANLEYAYQKDYAHNPKKFGFNYYMVEPSVTFGQWTLKAMHESIEGDGKTAMQFVLGTNHAFNGWVDKFLTTPVNGLVDHNVTLQYVVKSDNKWIDGTKTFIRYHQFRAQKNNPIMDYGRETNFFIEKSFKNNVTVGLQSGYYKAKGLYTNTSKIMPYINYKF